MEQLRSQMQDNVEEQSRGSQGIEARIQAEVANRTRELEDLVAEVSGDKAELLKQRDFIRGEVRRLSDKVVEADREKDLLQDQVGCLEGVIVQMQDKLDAAELETARVAEGAEAIKAEKEVLEAEIADLKSIQSSLLKQRELITGEVGRLTSMITTSRQDRAALDERITSMSKENRDLGARATAAEREAREAKEELAAAQQREAEQAKLLEQRDIFQHEVKRLTDQVVSVTAEKASLWEKVTTLEGVVSDLDEKAQAALRAQKDLIEEKISLLSNENATLLQQRAAISAEVSRIQEEIDASEQDMGQVLPGTLEQSVPSASEAAPVALQPAASVDEERVTMAEQEDMKRELASVLAAAEEVLAAAEAQEEMQAQASAAAQEAAQITTPSPVAEGDSDFEEISSEELVALDLKYVDLALDSPEAVRQWLERRRLGKYFPIFVEQGYDALIFLMNADREELDHLVDLCGMPKGYAKQLLRGVQGLQTLRPDKAESGQLDAGGQQGGAAA